MSGVAGITLKKVQVTFEIPEYSRVIPPTSALRALTQVPRKTLNRKAQFDPQIVGLADGHGLLLRGIGDRYRLEPPLAEVILVVRRTGRLLEFTFTGPYFFRAYVKAQGRKLIVTPHFEAFLVAMGKVHNGIVYTHAVALDGARELQLAYEIQEAVSNRRGAQGSRGVRPATMSQETYQSILNEVEPYTTPDLPTVDVNWYAGVGRTLLATSPLQALFKPQSYDRLQDRLSRTTEIDPAIRNLQDGQALLVRGYGIPTRRKNPKMKKTNAETHATEVILVVAKTGSVLKFTFTGPYWFESCEVGTKRKLQPEFRTFLDAVAQAHNGVVYTHLIHLHHAQDIQQAYAIQRAVDVRHGGKGVGSALFGADNRDSAQLNSLRARVKPYTTKKKCTQYPARAGLVHGSGNRPGGISKKRARAANNGPIGNSPAATGRAQGLAKRIRLRRVLSSSNTSSRSLSLAPTEPIRRSNNVSRGNTSSRSLSLAPTESVRRSKNVGSGNTSRSLGQRNTNTNTGKSRSFNLASTQPLSRNTGSSRRSLSSLRRAVDALNKNNTATSRPSARAPELLPAMSGSMGSKSASVGLNLNVERLAMILVSKGLASPVGFTAAQVELIIREMRPVYAGLLAAVQIRGTPDVIHLLVRRKGPEVAVAFSGGFRIDSVLTTNGSFRPPIRPFLNHMSTIYGPVDIAHMMLIGPTDMRAASRLLRDPRLNAASNRLSV